MILTEQSRSECKKHHDTLQYCDIAAGVREPHYATTGLPYRKTQSGDDNDPYKFKGKSAANAQTHRDMGTSIVGIVVVLTFTNGLNRPTVV